jgi:4-amino-4-deoxy-L-arabinose transferase-like glycosyltransferase
MRRWLWTSNISGVLSALHSGSTLMQSFTPPIPPRQATRNADRADRAPLRFLSRWDAVVLLGSALYLFLFYRHPWFSPDAGFIATGAERIVRGQVPFRDFFSELGPGTYYLQAGFFRLLGVGLPAVNVVAWLIGPSTSWLIYRLGKLVIEGPLALLPSCFFIAVCYPTNCGLSLHWTGSFFFLLMLLCLAESVSQTGWRHQRVDKFLWLVAGLLSCATLVCMQSKGVVAFLLGPAYLLVAEKTCGERSWAEAVRKGWQRGLWFLAGFGGALAAVTLFFVWNHATHDWLYDNFIFLVTNYWPFAHPAGSSWYALTHHLTTLVAHPSPTLVLFVLGYYFFMAIGPAMVLAGAVWCVRTLRDPENLRTRLILLLVFGSSGALLSELHSPDLEHFVVGGILMFPVMVSIYQSLLRRNPQARRLLVGAGAAVIVFVILGSVWQILFALKRNTPVATRRGTAYFEPHIGGTLSERVGVIQSRVAAGGETFIFIDCPTLYFLTATHNPTRFDNVIPVFHTPMQIEEVARSLLQSRPKFIFDLSREQATTEPVVVIPNPLVTFLRAPQSPYHLEQEAGLMSIWALGK